MTDNGVGSSPDTDPSLDESEQLAAELQARRVAAAAALACRAARLEQLLSLLLSAGEDNSPPTDTGTSTLAGL